VDLVVVAVAQVNSAPPHPSKSTSVGISGAPAAGIGQSRRFFKLAATKSEHVLQMSIYKAAFIADRHPLRWKVL
jgi:hypothetical protein